MSSGQHRGGSGGDVNTAAAAQRCVTWRRYGALRGGPWRTVAVRCVADHRRCGPVADRGEPWRCGPWRTTGGPAADRGGPQADRGGPLAVRTRTTGGPWRTTGGTLRGEPRGPRAEQAWSGQRRRRRRRRRPRDGSARPALPRVHAACTAGVGAVVLLRCTQVRPDAHGLKQQDARRLRARRARSHARARPPARRPAGRGPRCWRALAPPARPPEPARPRGRRPGRAPRGPRRG